MNPHFAKLGDVWKHLPLAEILRTRPPRHYWETHAGNASYPLTDSGARRHGALRFLSLAPDDPDLRNTAYLRTLRNMPGKYPGSAGLAMAVLGNAAQYVFCDIDPESAATLESVGAAFNAKVITGDGISAMEHECLAGTINPSDVLVHIDPFDADERSIATGKTPVELAAWLARAGYRVLYWYGYDDIGQRGWARHAISQLAPTVKLWCGDVLIPAPLVYPERTDAWGCGVVLANCVEAESSTSERLGRALQRVWATDIVTGNKPSALSFQVM
jgi:hypothetical protein